VANTIGKDKRATTSSRPAAASRVKTARAGVSRPTTTKPIAPKQADPVEQDVVEAEETEETEDSLDLVPAADADIEVDDADTEGAANELVVARPRTVARRRPAAADRGGVIGFVIRLLLLIPGARFVAASVQELRKVTAPTPREAWNMTLVVIGMSAAVAIILGAADLGLIRFLAWIVSLGTASSTGTH
jgi:preprotein translocase SecE subunit